MKNILDDSQVTNSNKYFRFLLSRFLLSGVLAGEAGENFILKPPIHKGIQKKG